MGVVVEPADKGVMSLDNQPSRLACGCMYGVFVKEVVAFGSSFLWFMVAVCGWYGAVFGAWIVDAKSSECGCDVIVFVGFVFVVCG